MMAKECLTADMKNSPPVIHYNSIFTNSDR